MSDRVEVVSAAIVRECPDGVKRLLMTQRSPDTSYGWLWCTPGGKREAGEWRSSALVRELFEECGHRAAISQPPWRMVYGVDLDLPLVNRPLRVTCYAVRPMHGAMFVPRDATIGLGWFDAPSLHVLDMAPADSANRDRLVRLVET